jgi:protein involved in polysaccharide export with SLBB domain
MNKEEFWATKSPLPEFHSITFSHPSFAASIRLVANQFAAVTLGGYVHTPAPMTIKPPDQTGNAQAKLSMAFPRQVVGREFKRQLKLTAGSRVPITVRYAVYLDDLATPALTWNLYVSDAGGVSFTAESVQVVATDDNPMRRSAAVIYDPSVYTGLELI